MGDQLTLEEAAGEFVSQALQAADDPSREKFTAHLSRERFRMPIDVSKQDKLVALVKKKAEDNNLKMSGRTPTEFIFVRAS